MSKSHQGVIGQLAMLASTLGIQILQVPVFLTSVGPTEYGIYLTLVAIPSAVALADLGLLAASATRMMTLVAVGDLEEARRVSRAVSTVLLLVLGLVGATSLLIVPFVELPQLEAGQAASRVVLIVFVGYAILNVLTSGTEGIMRAGGHYPRAWIAMSLIRATEFLVASGIIFLTQNVIAFALALLSSRLVATIWFAHYARRWTKWSDRRPSWRALTSIRSLFKPMVASIIQPLGNVLSIQGSVLVVSIILGPNAVVVYSTARTMFNAIRQGCMVFINAGMPGITVAQSTGRQSEAVRLWLKLLIMSAGLSGVGAVIVGVTAPLIITLWIGGKVAADPGLNWSLALLIVLDVVLTAGTLWLMGKNRHFPTAVALAGGTVVYLVLAVLTHPPSLADVSLIQCAVMVVIALVSASFVRRDMLNSKLS